MLDKLLDVLRTCIPTPLALAFACNLALAEAPTRVDFGKIEAIENFRASDGSGRGNTAATIAGVSGGAVARTEIGKKQVPGSHYRITMRLHSGSAAIVEDS